MGLPERVIARFERDAWVKATVAASQDQHYRPTDGYDATATAIRLAVIEDAMSIAKLAPGLAPSGMVLAYVRNQYADKILSKSLVWWDDAGNTSGVQYEVQNVEDYTADVFGQLGAFKRAILKRVEV